MSFALLRNNNYQVFQFLLSFNCFYFRSSKKAVGATLSGCEEMLIALKSGDYQTAENIIEHPHFNKLLVKYFQDNNGHTALHICTLKGNAVFIEKLITYYDADVNIIGGKEKLYTPLQMAAEKGDCAIIKALVKCGAKLDRTSDNESKWMSPLHISCHAGRIEAVKLLLRLGAQIHALNPQGGTILHSIVKGHWSICRQNTIYDPNLTAFIDCHHYYTAEAVIKTAAEKGLKVKDIGFWAPNRPPLLQYCLDYDLHNLLQLFIENGASLVEKDSDGETVLHRAAWTGNLQAVEYLSRRKETLNEKDTKGYTPLHNAIQQNHTHVCRCLIRNGADTQARIFHFKHAGLVAFFYSQRIRGVMGLTAMEMAIVLGHAEVLNSIVQQRIDDNVPATGDEVTALSVAWQYMKDKSKFLDCIKILFRLPGFLNISDINKSIEGTRKPMLHHAVEQHRFDIVKDLCTNCHVDLDCKDEDGKTVVQSLFMDRDPYLQQLNEIYLLKLVKYGASPNVLVSAGTLTPLIWAIRDANFNMVKVLIHAGAHTDQEISTSSTVLFSPKNALSAAIRFDYGSYRMLRMVLATDCDLSFFWQNTHLCRASPEKKELLLQKATTVLTLRQVARKHIRNALRHSLHIEVLPMPKPLKTFLFLPELQEI